jgi:predicted phosphodiesterase
MKLHILSDVHNEFYRAGSFSFNANNKWCGEIPETDADIIILAGDIDAHTNGVSWAIEQSKRLTKPILYIPGNHEFYNCDLPQTLKHMRRLSQNTEVSVMNNDEIIIQGVRFLGSILWTDYLACPTISQKDAMQGMGLKLIDHRLIQYNNELFTPAHALKLHQSSLEWLAARLHEPFEGKTVVITHHGPSAACQHPSFPLGLISTGFHSNLDDLVSLADLWVYGHTHACLDTEVNGVPLVSNQAGYPEEYVEGFDPKLVKEL